MENAISFLGLLAVVLFLLTIVKWANIGFQVFYSKLLCFFPSQIQSIWTKSNSDEKATKNVPTQQSQLNEAKGDVAMLSWEEIEMVMGKIGIVCCPKAKKQKSVGRLGGNEFSALFEETKPSLEEVEEAFAVFDENRDGFIDAEELQRVQCNLGFREAMELEACERMIGAFDTNGDGRIDSNEFVKLMETALNDCL